ncbi:MAG: bifunctional precorrin-2 dehydrogenase/sirohydrochlorin ferrochelatase [Clostridia bacterium]|nr:bifunctional precorrin-2 dehydrogenase/sirohydrochlorin ferrochelatase [Clostridia bacterium]
MSLFPVFIDIGGKKCVVVGGGSVAARKTQTLLMFDAAVTVISPGLSDGLCELLDKGRISFVNERYSKEALEGAFMVIAATDDSAVNAQIYLDAVEKGILVNVADCPEKCSFVFPSIVKRGDLVLGISTSGGFPALSKSIRRRLEKVFPESFGEILEVLKKYRLWAEKLLPDTVSRKRFITGIMEEILSGGEPEEIEAVIFKIEKMLEDFENEKGN